MDFRVFSRNISENMHARCVREDTKQALKGNLQADGVQSRQTLFVRYCLHYSMFFGGLQGGMGNFAGDQLPLISQRENPSTA